MLRCSIFIPVTDISSSLAMRKLPDHWFQRFDGDPLIVPIPENIPPEFDILRFNLKDKSDEKRFRLTRQRIDFEIAPQNLSKASINRDEFYRDAIKFLNEFLGIFTIKILRMAVNIHRYRKHDNPGLYLAQHFCRDEWWAKSPMNRPEHFEINSHKRFVLYNELTVNSWVRNKAGRILSNQEPIILIEQDINTLKEDENILNFREKELSDFYTKTPNELDHILSLYFPEK